MDKIWLKAVSLTGEVTVAGEKLVLALMPAATGPTPHPAAYVPWCRMLNPCACLETLGVKVRRYPNHTLMIDPTIWISMKLPMISPKMRLRFMS
jgi:hypothetical protein